MLKRSIQGEKFKVSSVESLYEKYPPLTYSAQRIELCEVWNPQHFWAQWMRACMTPCSSYTRNWTLLLDWAVRSVIRVLCQQPSTLPMLIHVTIFIRLVLLGYVGDLRRSKKTNEYFAAALKGAHDFHCDFYWKFKVGLESLMEVKSGQLSSKVLPSLPPWKTLFQIIDVWNNSRYWKLCLVCILGTHYKLSSRPTLLCYLI